jgi:hypothetical protein
MRSLLGAIAAGQESRSLTCSVVSVMGRADREVALRGTGGAAAEPDQASMAWWWALVTAGSGPQPEARSHA